MHRLVEKDPRNNDRIFPYIGGEEVNSSPTHAHHRYAINFFDLDEENARKWSDLMQIVEEKVKPERTRRNSKGEFVLRSPLPQRWWQYADKRPALVKAIAHCADATSPRDSRVLVIARHSPQWSVVFMSSGTVFSEALVIFPLSTHAAFCTLQSRIHEIWARFFSSTFGDGLRYTPSACFETFPFPTDWEPNPTLEAAGKAYYEFRANLMVRNNEGLTDTYNRFHDPDENDPDILKLQELHAQMDRTVLDAYGWNDISTDCEFLLDYEDEETKGSKRKKPWRYRWPEEVHDEILARLLKLNQERYKAEILGGKQAEGKAKGNRRSAKGKTGTSSEITQIPTIPGLDA